MQHEPLNDPGATVQLFENQDIYVVKQDSSEGVRWEGGNANGVAVVYPGPAALHPDDRQQLDKILAALKLDPNQVALINLSTVPAPAFSSIVRATECKYLIAFGPTPADMQMLVAAKRYIELSIGGCRVLFSDSLELLRQDAARKRYLWDCLQGMFGLR